MMSDDEFEVVEMPLTTQDRLNILAYAICELVNNGIPVKVAEMRGYGTAIIICEGAKFENGKLVALDGAIGGGG